MDSGESPSHLSRISTCWSLVLRAHQGRPDAATLALHELLERYGGAAHRYLLGALRDPDAADDLMQEFALRLVRGDFKRADPERGRFRDFLKTSLFHLIVDYRQRRRARPSGLPEGLPEPAVSDPEPPSEQEFLARWREGLLQRAWEALAAIEQQTGQPFYTVLRFRAENVAVRSDQMAEQLRERLRRPLTGAGVRQTLHRAREKFADLLLAEVARSLETDDPGRVEQELIDLDLLSYCRSALDRFARKA